MAILKPDGSAYSVSGVNGLNSYRPGGQDQELFDKLDQEQISLGGSEISYFKCFIDSNFDDLYMESRDSIIAQEGYKLKCVFEPVKPLQNLDQFGIDSPDELILFFNITKFREVVGEMPKVKSLIFAHWERSWWECCAVEHDGPYKLWTKYRLNVVVKKHQKSRQEQNPTRRDAIGQDGKKDISLNKVIF